VVRSLDEIVQATGVNNNDKSNVKLASRYYRMLVMEMGSLSLSEQPLTSSQHISRDLNLSDTLETPGATSISLNAMSMTSPMPIPLTLAIDRYIAKLANIAKIDARVQKLAIEIAHHSNNHLLADGKSPNGLAAAYIYLAATLLGFNLLQIDLSNLAGVTEVTIRNRCKDILTSFRITIKVKPVITRAGK
jgi:transcription initiation factor TFIIB